MRKWLSAGVLFGGAALVSACIYEEEPKAPAPQMVPASASVLTPHQAASVIAEARCDHEARCNGYGPAAQFSSREHCTSMLYHDGLRSFGGCHYGIKDRELRACVSQIHSQTCGALVNPLDWLNQVVTCRSTSLCLR